MRNVLCDKNKYEQIRRLHLIHFIKIWWKYVSALWRGELLSECKSFAICAHFISLIYFNLFALPRVVGLLSI